MGASVGRRTLLKHCIYKSNIKKNSYPFPEISLNYAESVEDFILKIYDLGFEDDLDIKGLMTKPLAEKISLAADLLATIQRLSDIIFIDDNGCIINQDGEFAEWFSKTIESEKIKDKFSVCIISRYRLRTFSGEISYSTKEKIAHYEVSELNKKERDALRQSV